MSQNIASNVRLPQGETVTLYVSNGVPPCCKVPDIKNMTIEEARATLKRERLELGETEYLSTDQVDEGTVIGQNPDAGLTKPPGTEVDIVVARKPEDKGKGNGKGNGGGND